jgi:GT2 family glycosyltransferase
MPTAPNESSDRTKPSASLGDPQVSVCIVTHNNNRELLSRCLDSAFAQQGDVSMEVLVADNGSTDDSVAWLRQTHPEVRVFENKNIGLNRAHNQLIRHAHGSMILFLDNDCALEKGSVRKLLDVMEKDPRIGILGWRILTGEGILQPTVMPTSFFLLQFLLPNPVEMYRSHLLAFGKNLNQRRQIMKAYETRHGYDRFREVGFVCGVSLLIRREVFETIGLLDENFFLYCEDVDLCLRTRRAGWKVCYTPAVSAHHFVRRNQDKGSPRLLTEAWFSRYYFLKKNYGQPWAALIAFRYFFQLVLSFFVGSLRFLFRRQPGREFLAEISWRCKAFAKILAVNSRA